MAGALLAAALIPLASAPSGDVPPDIAAWFDRYAADTVMEISRDLVVIDDQAPPQFRTVEVGAPRAVHAWSADFRAGRPTGTPAVPIGEWAAPYLGDDTPAGLVVAWHEEDVAALAYVDEAAELAATVAKLPGDAALVQAPELGAHYALIDGSVRTLHTARYGKTGVTVPLEVFQEQLSTWLVDAAGEPAGEAAGWRPTAVLAGAAPLGALLVTGALLVVRGRQRLSPDRRGDRGSDP